MYSHPREDFPYKTVGDIRGQEMAFCMFLYSVLVHYLAETQIYCGEKVIVELMRDPDSLATSQETFT